MREDLSFAAAEMESAWDGWPPALDTSREGLSTAVSVPPQNGQKLAEVSFSGISLPQSLQNIETASPISHTSRAFLLLPGCEPIYHR
jgi:hypothetical protein